MKISQKLILGYIGIALLAAVVGTICIVQNKKSRRIVEEQVYRSISYLNDVWSLMEAQEHQEIAANNYLFLDVGLEERRANYFHAKEHLEKIYQKYTKEACEDTKHWMEKYYENIKTYNLKMEETFELYRQGADPELIKARLREANEYAETAHEDVLEPIIEHVYNKHLEPAKENIAKGINRTTSATIVISMMSVFLAVVVGLFISRSISTPIMKLKNATVEIGKGKLNTRIEITSNDEVGQLAASFKKMGEDLKTSTTSIDNLNKEVAERKQTEQLLQESENKYRTLLENLPQKIFLKDRNSAYVSCNDNLARDFKIKAEEIAGKTDYDFLPEELANKYRADDERIMKSEKAEDIEESYLLDGEEVIVHTVKTPVKDEHGNVTGVLGIFWDITELKRAEEKIKELAKFPSENPNPIVKISKDYTILYANDAGAPLLETWGCEEGQRLPQPHSKLVEKVLSSGKAITCELESTSDQVFSVTLAPVVKAGYVNVYGLDITELRLSKEYLKQVREQAEVKAQFVSTVSHELRTPLTTMKEGVNIVLDGITGEINNKQRHFLDIIRRNIDRLARFINDVLDFQKFEAGKMEVDMRSNNMNEVVEEVIETMSCPANEKGLDLIAKLDETMPAVNFDRDRIIQVLINLVDNALKFTDSGNITIATAKADDTVRISVHDTGPGIKKENLPRLFHEFEQLSDTNERKTGGSGLGLAISRRIIEKHNGKIWAESDSGKGTTFYFELPVQEKKALAMAEKS